jgi:hypothetical protein
MEHEFRHLRDVSAGKSGDTPYEDFTLEEIDALEGLAEFEAEHRRILAMQTLYYKRRKGGGVA